MRSGTEMSQFLRILLPTFDNIPAEFVQAGGGGRDYD